MKCGDREQAKTWRWWKRSDLIGGTACSLSGKMADELERWGTSYNTGDGGKATEMRRRDSLFLIYRNKGQIGEMGNKLRHRDEGGDLFPKWEIGG